MNKSYKHFLMRLPCLLGTNTDITAYRELETELKRRQALLEDAQRIALLGHWDWHIERGTLIWSDQVYRLFGLPPQAFAVDVELFFRQIHPDDLSAVKSAISGSLEQGLPYAIDHRLLRLDNGEVRHVHEQGELVRDEQGRPLRMIGTVQDITERKRTEQALADQHRFLQSIIDGVADPILVIGTDYQVLLMNAAAKRNAPKNDDDSCLTCYCVLHHVRSPCSQRELACPLRQVIESGEPMRVIHRHADAVGESRVFELIATPLFDAEGVLQGVIEASRDITEQQRLLGKLQDEEARMKHLAHHDALTGLPNRLLFHDRLEQTVRESKRRRESFAVLFVDLDRFKQINDSLGHAAGDRLLQTIAGRLSAAVREEDTVARLGGDEFVVLQQQLQHPRDGGRFAAKLIETIQQPMDIEGHKLVLTSSIGVCLFPRNGTDAQTLLRNADAAMYRAKEQGRNNYQYYSNELTNEAMERLTLEAALREALERQAFSIQYQPQFLLATGQLTGAKATLQWHDAQRGTLSSEHFIPIAQESGLIAPLGRWLLEGVCRQFMAWRARGLEVPRLALNLWDAQWRQPDFLRDFAAILDASGCPGDKLELAVSESLLLRHPEPALKVFKDLRALGVELSIEDVGAGFSSLRHLKLLPIDKLIIGHSCVRELPEKEDDAAILAAVIALGASLGLQVMADGVENVDQQRCLAAHGCQQVSGPLYAPALSADELAQRWLTAPRRLTERR
jgi:diguanylate cyclase (GGDEF)-like protein/PAS domain S-box-containing protein